MMVESTELFPVIASDYPEASRRAYSKGEVLRDGLIVQPQRRVLEELYGAFQLAPWCGAI